MFNLLCLLKVSRQSVNIEKGIKESSATVWRRGQHKRQNCKHLKLITKINKNITTIKEDLTDYFYVLAQVHSKEIRKLYEFDDDKLQFTMELETYERERMQPTKEQL